MTSTTGRFVDDINRLVSEKKTKPSQLQDVTFEPIVAVRSISEANQPPKGESTEGIASPLVEIPGKREYFPSKLIKSSDGLFVLEQQSLKKATFKDANGEQVIIEFTED